MSPDTTMGRELAMISRFIALLYLRMLPASGDIGALPNDFDIDLSETVGSSTKSVKSATLLIVLTFD
jgi:hypothetical protein